MYLWCLKGDTYANSQGWQIIVQQAIKTKNTVLRINAAEKDTDCGYLLLMTKSDDQGSKNYVRQIKEFQYKDFRCQTKPAENKITVVHIK